MNYTEAVKLALEGRQDGFNALYESTYQSKYYLALKYMQNEESAKDVLQDSYIKAFSNLDALDDPEKFSSWLGVIVANTAKNELKKQNLVFFADVAADPGEEYENMVEDENIQNQPEAAFLQKESLHLVRELIDSLSAEQRMCILMFHMERQSIREIADALGCSENTVKSRLKYGRKNIKLKAEELQKKGYRIFTVALLVPLLESEEKALAAQGVFDGAKRTVADHIMKSLSATGRMTPSGLLKRGFLKTLAGKAVAAGIGVGIVTAGVIGVVMFGQNKEADPMSETMADVNVTETEPTGRPAGEPAQAVPTEGIIAPPTDGPIPTEGIIAPPTDGPVPTEGIIASPTEGPAQAIPTTVPDDGSAPDLFGKLPENFTFSSGVGGWRTKLYLKADGTFSGEYTDSDLGITGKKYPKGMVYICNFTGKFSTPKKVNKYTYSTTLESLQIKEKPGGVYYKNGKKYIASEAYGIEGGREFLIYLPSAPLSKLSDAIVTSLPYASNLGTKLKRYAIYNVSEQGTFFG